MPESGTQPHILVVDDARDIREPLVRYLKESGYRASAADSAAAARRAMRTSGIDLVILDIERSGARYRVAEGRTAFLCTGGALQAELDQCN